MAGAVGALPRAISGSDSVIVSGVISTSWPGQFGFLVLGMWNAPKISGLEYWVAIYLF